MDVISAIFTVTRVQKHNCARAKYQIFLASSVRLRNPPGVSQTAAYSVYRLGYGLHSRTVFRSPTAATDLGTLRMDQTGPISIGIGISFPGGKAAET
jgi:hypothetical protein